MVSMKHGLDHYLNTTIVQWKGKDTRFFLTNAQSIINKLDMILHHMEVDKIDIGFITIDQELVISQSKNAGYTISFT